MNTSTPAADSFSPSPILRRDNVTPPDWLLDGFANRGYWQLPLDFCDLMFTKDEYTIELNRCLSDAGVDSWRAMGTVDGDTYISISEGFLFCSDGVDKYLDLIEPRLSNLADQL